MMMPSISILPAAEEEITGAFRWYEDKHGSRDPKQWQERA